MLRKRRQQCCISSIDLILLVSKRYFWLLCNALIAFGMYMYQAVIRSCNLFHCMILTSMSKMCANEHYPEMGPNFKLAWNTISSAILWSVWKERNPRFFENKRLEEDDLFQIAKWRLCAWLGASLEFKGLRLLDFYTCWEGCLSGSHKKSTRLEAWSSLHSGMFKFNVGLARISKILWNLSRSSLLVFSNPIGVRDSKRSWFVSH